jgi:hypothetical protein
MANKAFQYYKELPAWAKGVIAVVAVGGVVIIGWKVYKAIQKTTEEQKDKELLQGVDKEVKDLQNKGIKPSFKPSDYLQYAQTIHDSMKVCVGDSYGTAQDTLKKMKNDLDVALLIKAFGKRQDYCFGVPLSEYALFSYVQKELGNEWGGITGYRVTDINADWKKKGITYQI